jgi:hypothetical protein
MLQVVQQLEGNHKSLLFYITSNEGIDLKFYKNRNLNVEIGTGQFIEDLYSLSLCDYIFGPPSTYSLWAAMYGGIKYCHMKSKSQILSLAEFTYY